MRAYAAGVRVSVPATSANLGPGYDSLGLALDLRDVVTARVLEPAPGGSPSPQDVEVTVTGVCAKEVPLDSRHLVYQSMCRAFDVMGRDIPRLRLHCDNAIPHGRGLGSSSAAIVAGIVAARALVPDGSLLLDDNGVFALAASLEGHPDNVAPAVFGGFTIACPSGDGFLAASVRVDPRVELVVLVPASAVETTVARGLLPETVSHAAASQNAGRTALLVAALSSQPELLLAATVDVLHQSYRATAMPETMALIHRLRGRGVAAVLSGAGPAVLAFVDAVTRPRVIDSVPPRWEMLELAIDRNGASATVLEPPAA